jgi:hypothetical protein
LPSPIIAVFTSFHSYGKGAASGNAGDYDLVLSTHSPNHSRWLGFQNLEKLRMVFSRMG